jgi:hypothetical protein
VRHKILLIVLPFLLACSLLAVPSTPRTPTPPAEPTSPVLPVEATSPPTVPPGSAPLEIVPVPSTEVLIDGVPYLSYQIPGDPFRFVCQQPCKGNPASIQGQYAGFSRARQLLIQMTGIDTLTEIQPVDIHLTNDNKCGNLDQAGALSFAWYDLPGNAYVCTFLFEYRGVDGENYTAELASAMYNQTIFVHEYLHTFFFGRLPQEAGALHDLVTPLAIHVTGEDQAEAAFCAYHPVTPPGDFNGNLVWELCRQNGFNLQAFKTSLMELDALFQAGGGTEPQGFSKPTPSMAQYRAILDRLLGGSTRQAFADACWSAALFGDDYQLSEACLHPTPAPTPTPLK